MLQRIARISYARRRLVVVGWIFLLVGLSVLGSALGGAFRSEFKVPGSDSQAFVDLVESRGFPSLGGRQGTVVFSARDGVDDAQVEEVMTGFFETIARDVKDVQVVSPYDDGSERQIAANGRVAYAEVNFADRANEQLLEDSDAVKADLARLDLPAGLRVELGGEVFRGEPELSSELIGVLCAIVILLVAFGSLLAMGLPILTALFGIGCGFALVTIATKFIDMPDVTTQATAMIGIGVGIDYALFIVTRYRQGLHDGLSPEAAVVRAIDTAGRAVLFAGTTVVISLLAMVAVGVQFMTGIGIGMALGVVATMAASVTLLPAVLGFVGRSIDRFALPGRRTNETQSRTSIWYRWSRIIQHRPWPACVAALGVLVLLGVPLLSMRLGFSDTGNLPTTDTTRRAYDMLSRGFGPGSNGPFYLGADLGSDGDPAVLDELQARLEELPGVALVTPAFTNDAGNAAVMTLVPTTSPQDERTNALLEHIRDDVVPAVTDGTGVEVHVGGITASAEDFAALTGRRLPLLIGIVLVLSFLLLMMVFRSVLVPLKAVVMNLLSIGAAYGLTVAVFQWGWGGGLIGIGKEGPIEAWAPLFLFAIIFGLSMDYEVFLLSRIREEYDRTHDNATAVADGLAATARVITAAAAIMVCVFGAFVLGPDRALKVFGFGLAIAVFLDATIVRMILVPATMELLGDRNWWLPGWLDRILPVVHVEPIDDVDAELEELLEGRDAVVEG